MHARFMEFEMDRSKLPALDSNAIKNCVANVLPKKATATVGIGLALCGHMGLSIAGLSDFPEFPGANPIPSSQGDLWIRIQGESIAEIALHCMEIEQHLRPIFVKIGQVDGFKYDVGRDLTGYEDGTENPEGEDAIAAAIIQGEDIMNQSTFVAVQKWQHDFSAFHSFTQTQQDELIGRHISNNEEFDAPESAHVKRTAQEDFDPEAFLVRRSMPWSDSSGSGLLFIAFATRFYPFQAQMVRMTGAEDGIVDGLFSFSKPVTGAYYWCPAVSDEGKLNV